jgi:tryptophan synthase alpha chain
MVSAPGTTGQKAGGDEKQIQYFERIQALGLHNPKLIGFGISDRSSFEMACRYAEGAIIGSAFIKVIQEKENLEQNIRQFIQEVKAAEAVPN